MLGELLDRPHAGAVSEFSVSGTSFVAHREIEGAIEIVEGTLPALIAWDKGSHAPRYPSLKGIMAAKKKPLEVKTRRSSGSPRGRPSSFGSRSNCRRRVRPEGC